jgi:CRP/FNR family transcriptional regulator
MTREAQHSYCTDTQWVGRSECRVCNIRSMMLFSGLPDEAFERLLRPIDNMAFPPGAILYEAGTHGDVVYTIRRGLVKMLHVGADGSQRILRLLGAGSAVGLELLDGGDVYRHSAVAANQVDACRIPVVTIEALEHEFPELTRQARQRLQQHLDRTDEWVLTMGSGPARQRLAHLLLFLTRYTADRNGDIELLSGEDMAAVVGTSVETVSRVVADLKRRGLLERVAAHLYRCDTQAIEALANDADA